MTFVWQLIGEAQSKNLLHSAKHKNGLARNFLINYYDFVQNFISCSPLDFKANPTGNQAGNLM